MTGMQNNPGPFPDEPEIPPKIDGRSPTDFREAALMHAVEVAIAGINHKGTVGGVDNIVDAAEKFRAFLAGESPVNNGPSSAPADPALTLSLTGHTDPPS